MKKQLIEPCFTLHPSQTTTCTREQLREWLLNTAQPRTYGGEMYHIRSRHLGAGVYEVWSELWKGVGK